MVMLLCALAGATGEGAFEGVGAPPLSEPLSDPAEIDARTDTLAGILRCPVCQGLSVADSREGASLTMKGRIREMVAAGYTDEQVIDYFVDRYGEGIVLLPDQSHWMIWTGPVVALLVGAGVVLLRTRRREEPLPLPRAKAAAPIGGDDPHRVAILAELED